MMPHPVTNSINTYVVLHELNKSQLNICEVQISGICARCSALGELLTQEITEHKSSVKKNKANKLVKELHEISTAINKNLVQQLPLIKKQMEQSLSRMTSQESTPLTNAGMAQDRTYIKTVDLLQENIVRIDQQLNIAMNRVLEVIPQTKQNQFQKLLKALTIYQSTICGTSLLSTEFNRLDVFLDSLKANIELYLSAVRPGPEKNKLQEFTTMIDRLVSHNQVLFESFQTQEVNNLPILKVRDSAELKFLSLSQQLTKGDVSNADVLLAVAQRHETSATVEYSLQESQLIHGDFNTLSSDVQAFLEKIQLDDINSLADELIQAEQTNVAVAAAMIKKPCKTGHPAVEQEIKRDVASKPRSNKNENFVEKPSGTQFHVELSKLADWLNHDVKALKNSASDEKRKLGQVIAEQLEEIYGQIDANEWPAGKTEALEHKTDIEKRLSGLEQLIAEAMAQNSPPHSPKASPQPEPRKSPENVVELESGRLEPQSSPYNKLPEMPAQEAAAQVVAIRHVPKPVSFDNQLQLAIQKLNSARTKMFDAHSRQESFRQKLLESNQPHSLAWVNINQTDMVLDCVSYNITSHAHALYVRPYAEHHVPMAQMIRAIQADRFHPHFDQRNCQAYLGRASNWLDTLAPHFDYLDQLMSITESMLTNQQRVA